MTSVTPRRQPSPLDNYVDIEDGMERLHARYCALYATQRNRIPSSALQIDGSSRVPKELHEGAVSAWEFSAPELALFPDGATVFRVKCKVTQVDTRAGKHTNNTYRMDTNWI